MLQRSKIIRSRDEWKLKAVQRAEENREQRKTLRRYRQKLAQLKATISALETAPEVQKKSIEPTAGGQLVDLAEARQVRTLCVLLVLQAVVSFRSVPRILELFRIHAPLDIDWVPHFTSVINWTLRVGLGLLKQVAPIDTPWVAIIDHSIDVGTKKALVVLRVPLAALSLRGAAIQLADCECVGLTVAETVTGDIVAGHLEAIFQRSGAPSAILKDGDATLNKGVRVWMGNAHLAVAVIEDISHVMAAALKAQFEPTTEYKRFTALASKAANALRQTQLAFLIPPKLRSKGRFLNLGKLARWGEKMLAILAVKGRAPKGSPLAKLRAALPGFIKLRAWIETFATTAVTLSQIMEILKNKGLQHSSHAHCCQLAEQLPANSDVKRRLQTWLNHHIDIQHQLTTLPLLVSSDIIESLFGNFKHLLERSPQADMNRTVLLIPALCGQRDAATLSNALIHARHVDLVAWEQKNIPDTMRKKRLAFFAKEQSQKAGNS